MNPTIFWCFSSSDSFVPGGFGLLMSWGVGVGVWSVGVWSVGGVEVGVWSVEGVECGGVEWGCGVGVWSVGGVECGEGGGVYKYGVCGWGA